MTAASAVLREDIDGRLSLVEYQLSQFSKKLDRIEENQMNTIRQIDTLKYVDQHQFEQYKEYAEKRYVTNESNKPQKTLFWAIVTAIITGVIVLGLGTLVKK